MNGEDMSYPAARKYPLACQSP